MARKGTYSAAYYDADGCRKWAYGRTPQEARENAIRKETLSKAGVKELNDSTTVKAWAEQWLTDYKKGTVNNKWYKQMEALIDTHISPHIGTKKVKDVKPTDLNKLLNGYTDKSQSFQKKLLIVLRQIFDSAEENDLIDKSPAKRIKVATTGEKQGYRTITDAERSLTLQTAEKYPSDGIFFLIMLYCGCRPQEVARLKMSDYDRDRKILTVSRARKSDGSTGTTKSAAGMREIPVPDYLAERLERLGKKRNEYICTALNGSPLTATSQRSLWHRFKRNMDILNGAVTFRNAIVKSTLADDLVPYCYRHTYCTDLQDAGVPVTVAKVLMGHSDISVTANIYTHRTESSIEDAREKINKSVENYVDNCGTSCGTEEKSV